MAYADSEDQKRAARRHYEANLEKYKARAQAFKVIARLRNRDYVDSVKNSRSCVDCGISYPPYIMQFDHLSDDKDANVADMVNRAVSVERIAKEIAKCELVCANCHAERTHQRKS